MIFYAPQEPESLRRPVISIGLVQMDDFSFGDFWNEMKRELFQDTVDGGFDPTGSPGEANDSAWVEIKAGSKPIGSTYI